MLTTGNYLEEFKWENQGKNNANYSPDWWYPSILANSHVLLTDLLLANGGFEPTAKKNNVSPAKPLFRCVSCFHLVLASGKWWSLAYSQEESYSIHKEHPDHFHKYCSLLALQNILKAHHAEKSLSSAKKKRSKSKMEGPSYQSSMLIKTLYVSNQNHLAQSKISWWVTTWCLCPPNHALIHHQGLASLHIWC